MSIHSNNTPAAALAVETRKYTREPEAIRQLSLFDGLASGAALEVLFGPVPAARVCEEVLVTLLRRFSAAGEDDAAWRVAGELTQRVKGRIARTLRLWRLDQPISIAEEVVDDIITTLYDALFEQAPGEQFWEIRFWVAFDRKVLKIVQAQRRENDARYEASSYSDKELQDNLDALHGRADTEINLRDPVTGTLVGEALALLSSGERTAFLLKHVARMPEDSARDDGSPTIARVLNVSPRTVRNYLSRAEKTLSEWRCPTLLSSRP